MAEKEINRELVYTMVGGDHFTRDEVKSIYANASDRFIVSLVVGYDDDPIVKDAKDAAAHALSLLRDGECGGTIWHVFDRKTGEMHVFKQEEFDDEVAE
jgi:hypothetical protein